MNEVCCEYADALVDYSDDELSPDDRLAVEEHLAACPACGAELARLDGSLDRLRSGISIQTVSARNRTGMSSPLGWCMAIAACVLLCLGAAWWSGLRRTDSNMAKVVQSPRVETPSAARISSHDALWQIALLEQQARLQTSLEMLPKDESFADQRREDERLLAKFQSMALAAQSGLIQ